MRRHPGSLIVVLGRVVFPVARNPLPEGGERVVHGFGLNGSTGATSPCWMSSAYGTFEHTRPPNVWSAQKWTCGIGSGSYDRRTFETGVQIQPSYSAWSQLRQRKCPSSTDQNSVRNVIAICGSIH